MREDFLPHATLYEKNKILICEEKNKKLYLHTKEANFYRVKIDGGVEQGNLNKKCDFILIKEDKKIWIYTELKGSKIGEAYQQILKTFEKYKEKEAINYTAIVLKRCPKMDTSIQNIQIKLKEKGFKELFQKEKNLCLVYVDKDKQKPIKIIKNKI